MRIHNRLPLLLSCLERWEHPPELRDFDRRYFRPMEKLLGPMLGDWGIGRPEALYRELLKLDWPAYRAHVLQLAPEKQEKRILRHVRSVERLLGVPLRGEIVLFGAFEMMDGYARFDRGRHRVFLGLDEIPSHPRYLDVLITHELTHVARETLAPVWEGFGPDSGLSLEMTHEEFTQRLPVVEHLFNEGFACAVSETLLPGLPDWLYVYQTQEAARLIRRHGAAVNRAVHRELRKPDGGDYGRLYDSSNYRPRLPLFCHYVWARAWVRALIAEHGDGKPAALLRRCSREFHPSALRFRLP
ncbi:MAG: hypothetical protein NDJ90_01415 [Oligoflexia bacterium]|nr:hypothetical protein [Oligoflexia bacterium]